MPAPKNAKLPSDRKAPAEKPLAPEETPGWELMRPMHEIPVWEQTPLIGLLQGAFEDSKPENKKTDEEIDAMTKEEWELYQAKQAGQERNFDINIIGDLAKALIPYSVDEKAYRDFCSGAGAMQRVMTLAMAWVGQMGEFGSSEA
jgi:hypothetical protein